MALTAKKVYAILKRQISDMEAKIKTPVIYKGTVATADLLPLNPDIGDMYNIESKSVYGEAGMNVAWNGVVWDTMGAPIDMSLYFTKEEAEAVIQRLVTEYFEKNPVKPGATTEQAQQIEQNKTDIASLKTETGSLKEDIEANKENIITLANALNSSFTKEIQFEMIQNSVILKSNGKPYTNSKLSGYSVSDYIPVESGAYRVIASAQYDGNILYAIYDEGKNPIVKGDVATSSVTICDDVIFVPANGKYIVVSQISGKKSKVLRLADEMVFSPVEFDYEAKKCITTKWTIADSGTFDFFIAKVPVIGGSKVKLSATTNWGNPHYGFANVSGEIVSLKSSGNGIQSLTEEVVDIPTNASYILVNCYAKYPVKIETLQKPKELKWSDKKWVVIGDSLTNLNGRAYIHYFDYISLCTGISVQNMGVSDTGYAKGTNNNAFYQRLDDIDTSSDVITIFGSFNDLTSSKSLGNITDTGIETICGCINTTIDRIYEKMPLANLGIVAPCPWSQYTPMDSDTSTCVQYVNALENITKHRGIPYLDLFRTSGIRPWESSIRDVLYTQDEGGGTHPNAKGHKILSAKFEGFLNSLLLD